MSLCAIDVECVATGLGHSDRELCRIAVVTLDGGVLLDQLIKPEKPVVSYLTPITGLSQGCLDGAPLWKDARAKVHALFSPSMTIVGQCVNNDIKWLELERGVHYAEVVDIAELFSAWNPRFDRVEHFSLAHEVKVLLGETPSGAHNPVQECKQCLQLYKKYAHSVWDLAAAKKKLYTTPRTPSTAKALGFSIDGVCLAAYSPERCTCRQPTLAVAVL